MASHDANPVSLSYSVTVTAGYSDRHEPVMKILMGEYIAVGEHHGRTVFQRANKRAVFLYFWDNRDGAYMSGWWFGRSLESTELYAFAPTSSTIPPRDGWTIPCRGLAHPTFQVMTYRTLVTSEQEESQGSTSTTSSRLKRKQTWGTALTNEENYHRAELLRGKICKLGTRLPKAMRTELRAHAGWMPIKELHHRIHLHHGINDLKRVADTAWSESEGYWFELEGCDNDDGMLYIRSRAPLA